jgi:glycerol-3-phosphate acyltransferase PlsX
VPRIAIDAMSGDRAPDEIVKGAALASLAPGDLELILVGDTAQIGKVLAETSYDAERLRIHHAGEVVRAGERAAEALAARPDASIAVCAELAKQNDADAVITAGPTQAALLACTGRFRRLTGVASPALAGVYPTEMRRGEKDDPFALILDVGARLDATPQDLAAYAVMGAAYATQIARNPRPRVALLGAGELDPGGGPSVVDEAHELILHKTGLNFIGRIAATDVPHGIADVVVASGYAGNLVISLLEGVGETVLALARYAYKDKLLWRAALGMLSGGIGRLKSLTDWNEYGGAPLLGYETLLLRVHPSSGERAVANAIKVGARAVAGGLNQDIQRRLAELEEKLAGRTAKPA